MYVIIYLIDIDKNKVQKIKKKEIIFKYTYKIN